VTREIIVPREAMGLGDVKFMAAIGAFLGWQATLFSLMVSAVIGSVVGVIPIIFGKQEWSSRLPYGPYIALAAVIWIFGGRNLAAWWFR
jgi:leader peptidase (prepilin peptidase)/N-methyltransferase